MPGRTRWLGASLVALATLGAPGTTRPARADGGMSEATAEQRDLARSHFRRGRAHQDARAYDQAIVEYQAAYALAPTPEMLFNIGQCYRLKGERTHALVYYQRYLQQVPEGGASADARAHIAALRRPGGVVDARTAGASGAAIRGGAGATATRDDADDGGRRAWRWIGAGGALAGAAFVGLGVWSGLEAADTADRVEAARGPVTPELLALAQEGEAAESRMWIYGGVGVALVVAGGVSWWLAGREPDAPRAGVTAGPVLSPGLAGVLVSGQF